MLLRRLAGCAARNSLRVDNRQRILARYQLLREIDRNVVELPQLNSVDHGLVDLLAVLPMLADGSMVSPEQPVKRIHRIIQGGIETRPKMTEVVRIELETTAFRPFDEPMKCFVRETV